MSSFADLEVGKSLPEIQLSPVTRLDLIKYAGASGDFNPIHTIDAEAKSAGLPAIIAHGMWTMGSLAKLFTPHFEEGFIQDYSIRFRGMVFIDDIITLRATLAEMDSEKLTFTVAAVNQHEKDVVSGSIVFSKLL